MKHAIKKRPFASTVSSGFCVGRNTIMWRSHFEKKQNKSNSQFALGGLRSPTAYTNTGGARTHEQQLKRKEREPALLINSVVLMLLLAFVHLQRSLNNKLCMMNDGRWRCIDYNTRPYFSVHSSISALRCWSFVIIMQIVLHDGMQCYRKYTVQRKTWA